MPPSASPASVFHGGALDAARQRFPHAPSPWIDLSTGINPMAYPLGALPAEVWQRLPEALALAQLEAAAARAYGARPVEVVAAPGTQALIQWLARLLPAQRVAVLGFGYEEHPVVWRAAGAEVVVTDEIDALERADVAVVVNPNNPDGRWVEPARLSALADVLAGQGGTLIVDEAFMDTMDPASSMAPALPPHGVVVLRSFGKFYGLAGVRLGFALAGADLALRLRAALGPWAVSGPAMAIGTKALADDPWRRATLDRLGADAERLDALLVRAGFAILGGTPLYRLATHDEAMGWYERFGRAGILVRPFPARPRWLRFGLPADEVAWGRLDETLSD